jgi:peptide/nickel transport system substrate-binding protein
LNSKITKSVYFLFFILLTLQSCKTENPVKSNRIIVGLSADVQTFSPLFALSLDEGSISELLFLSLIQPDWNQQESNLELKPMFAKSWEWSPDSNSITFNLHDDVFWSDSVKCTAEDVVFSFDAYSDPDVQSRLLGTFEDFYVEKNQHLDLSKTFEILSPYKLKINFLPNSNPNLFNIGVPIIPKHIFEKIKRKDFSTAPQNLKPISNGPFYLSSWEKNQAIILKTNKTSFLAGNGNISELVFKIIPDYNARLTQLKKGEIDLMELIQPGDVAGLKSNEKIKIASVKGREYDYIGWENIAPEVFNKSKKIVPNKFFGNANVRKAMTYAINRKEILDEYLNDYGELAVTPVTPIFKNVIDTNLNPYPYDVNKAKQLLKDEGWTDSNNDGILDKNGVKFSFTLNIPSGNPRREFASTVVKNNLREVGIDVNIAQMEMGVFLDNIFGKKVDAWMASWVVPIPIELKPYWYSDVNETPANPGGYQNKEIDKILIEMEKKIPREKLKKLYFKFQKIIYENEPATFLYWMDDIVGYNRRIKNIDINPLGVIQKCWNWTISE